MAKNITIIGHPWEAGVAIMMKMITCTKKPVTFFLKTLDLQSVGLTHPAPCGVLSFAMTFSRNSNPIRVGRTGHNGQLNGAFGETSDVISEFLESKRLGLSLPSCRTRGSSICYSPWRLVLMR